MLAADMILHCGNHEKFNMEMIMALDADVAYPTYDAPEKDLYELGEYLHLDMFQNKCMHGQYAEKGMVSQKRPFK